MKHKDPDKFDVFTMNQFKLDLLLFYKENSKIPIYAAFLYLDFDDLIIKLSVNQTDIFMNALNYLSNVSVATQFDMASPKFRILNE